MRRPWVAVLFKEPKSRDAVARLQSAKGPFGIDITARKTVVSRVRVEEQCCGTVFFGQRCDRRRVRPAESSNADSITHLCIDSGEVFEVISGAKSCKNAFSCDRAVGRKRNSGHRKYYVSCVQINLDGWLMNARAVGHRFDKIDCNELARRHKNLIRVAVDFIAEFTEVLRYIVCC
jgi:hypothetical protein